MNSAPDAPRAVPTHNLFGPYNLQEFLARGFRCIHNAESGVYLWTVHLADGSYKICYVGQTISSFRKRILEECSWSKRNETVTHDLDAYARGRLVEVASGHPLAEDYLASFRALTFLFFMPLTPGDSPIRAREAVVAGAKEVVRNHSLYKPHESAILRQLYKTRELASFLLNRRGIELHAPKYPCVLNCNAAILGLGGHLEG